MFHNENKVKEEFINVNQFKYIGSELKLFSEARNWKNYIKTLIGKYIKGDVLEVGAGIGSNTYSLCCSQYNKWLCLEPDIKLFQTLENSIDSYGLVNCYAHNGTIETLSDEQLFNSILYLDVLEHIYKDKEEIIKACQHLKFGGNLIILAPAHQSLFTPFDAAIGHYRRYEKSTLKVVLPDYIEVIKLIYVDCVGLLASLGNKLILQQNKPTLKQIKIWDNLMIPISRKLDSFLGHRFGKSILLIGRKKCH